MQSDNLTAEWHDVAARDLLDAAFPLGVEVLGQPVGICLHDDELRAFEDIVPLREEAFA